jgi:hypothetical protein
MKPLPVLVSVALVVAGLRLGWVYLERSQPGPPAAKASPGVPAALNTTELKILNFYVPAAAAVRGEQTLLCYGVLNAASVRLTPPLAELSPSLARCVHIVLSNETELTLTATSKEGHEASRSFVIGTTEPKPEFLFVEMSGRETKAGEPHTICYGVKNASSVRLLPVGQMLPPIAKTCVRWYPAAPVSYRLVAESPGGRDVVPLPLKVLTR